MGYSLDLVLSWLPTKSVEMKLEMLDVFSKVKWNNAPYTKATGDSNNKEYDESGYVKYNPVISGVESNRDYTQKIPRKIFIGGSYQILDEYALALEYSDFDVEDFLYFGLSRSINEHRKVSVLYCIEARATGFSYSTRNFSLELITDKISVSKARLFGLKLSYVLMAWR